MLRRLPIESSQPLVLMASVRLVVVVGAAAAVLVLGFPYGGRAAVVLGAVAVPWSLLALWFARRDPDKALSPAIAVGDFVVLVVLEAVVPETYAPVRFAAFFVVATHAAVQGERRGMAVAAAGSAGLVVAGVIRGDTPVEEGVLAFYEVAFVVSSLATALVIGGLRTSESAGRLRARGLSRRALQSESDLRRRMAEAIHDGPVQELIGLDMILSSARKAALEGRGADAADLLEDARKVASRNIRALRDEIVDLGPYAFEELTFDVAIENCLAVWNRRYPCHVSATIERIELSPELGGALFRIVQEAVLNAGRHAEAETVSISLRSLDGDVELRVADDGKGFEERDHTGASEPGHLGLASMRERAELLDGRLEIESSDSGTLVLVRVPQPRPARRPTAKR